MQEGTCLGIDRRAQKIIGGGIANIELDSAIELGEFEEIGFAKFAGFDWRVVSQSFRAELKVFDRRNSEDVTGNSANRTALEYHAAGLHLRSVARGVACKYRFFAVV